MSETKWPLFIELCRVDGGIPLLYDESNHYHDALSYVRTDAARAWQAFRDWCGPSRACVWTQSEYDLWETDCNGAFQLNDGGPYDNDMRFCCYCGSALVERPYEDAEDDSDD